jgi:hypothetical protein
MRYGRITVKAGTKGGKKRQVPCLPQGIQVLELAMQVQDGRSMIPKTKSYVEFHDECYEIAHKAGIRFHSERHFYAQERYREITSAPSPIDAGWSRKERISKLANYLNTTKEQAKIIDHDARLQISIELGHNRVEITNVYVG